MDAAIFDRAAKVVRADPCKLQRIVLTDMGDLLAADTAGGFNECSAPNYEHFLCFDHYFSPQSPLHTASIFARPAVL